MNNFYTINIVFIKKKRKENYIVEFWVFMMGIHIFWVPKNARKFYAKFIISFLDAI